MPTRRGAPFAHHAGAHRAPPRGSHAARDRAGRPSSASNRDDGLENLQAGWGRPFAGRPAAPEAPAAPVYDERLHKQDFWLPGDEVKPPPPRRAQSFAALPAPRRRPSAFAAADWYQVHESEDGIGVHMRFTVPPEGLDAPARGGGINAARSRRTAFDAEAARKATDFDARAAAAAAKIAEDRKRQAEAAANAARIRAAAAEAERASERASVIRAAAALAARRQCDHFKAKWTALESGTATLTAGDVPSLPDSGTCRWEVLGIEGTSDAAVKKKAIRTAAVKYHPDKFLQRHRGRLPEDGPVRDEILNRVKHVAQVVNSFRDRV